MKRLFILALVLTLAPVPCNAASNKQLVKKYIKAHYSEFKVKWYKHPPAYKKLVRRQNKVLVVRERSYSRGWYGVNRCGIIYYNKKVRRGKRVTSYLIYNPHTNYCDDIVAVVDNGRIR